VDLIPDTTEALGIGGVSNGICTDPHDVNKIWVFNLSNLSFRARELG